jgi:two-component system chemotaxis response regulator CheB
MRGILRTLFERQANYMRADLPHMELVGVARDGVECLQQIPQLAPDVLILDLEMPRMNGLDVLDRLRHTKPKLPVIMCSSHTERGARATFDALARGAADYVMKPAGQRDLESALASLAEQLLPRIAAFGGERPTPAITTPPRLPDASISGVQRLEKSSGGRVEVLVIGVSTGGPTALEQLLPRLSPDLGVPALIVQHMPKVFTNVLAERLNRCSPLKVVEGRHGAALHPGVVWLAPGDMHMEVAVRRGGPECSASAQIKLHSQEPLHHCRPAVDYLFHSAARLYGEGALAVVLTGMGSDGLDGARAVHERGGVVLAQDEASSAVWGMPGRVAEAGIAAAVLPLDALARQINHRVSAGRSRKPEALSSSSNTPRRREVSHDLY